MAPNVAVWIYLHGIKLIRRISVSTMQCICGSTAGIALNNGTFKALIWRLMAKLFGGWITMPILGYFSGIFNMVAQSTLQH